MVQVSYSATLLQREKIHKVTEAITLARYFETADRLLNQAAVYGACNDIKNQYVALYRFTSLVLNTISKHPSLASCSGEMKLKQYKQKCVEVIDQMEALKPEVDKLKPVIPPAVVTANSISRPQIQNPSAPLPPHQYSHHRTNVVPAASRQPAQPAHYGVQGLLGPSPNALDGFNRPSSSPCPQPVAANSGPLRPYTPSDPYTKVAYPSIDTRRPGLPNQALPIAESGDKPSLLAASSGSITYPAVGGEENLHERVALLDLSTDPTLPLAQWPHGHHYTSATYDHFPNQSNPQLALNHGQQFHPTHDTRYASIDDPYAGHYQGQAPGNQSSVSLPPNVNGHLAGQNSYVHGTQQCYPGYQQQPYPQQHPLQNPPQHSQQPKQHYPHQHNQQYPQQHNQQYPQQHNQQNPQQHTQQNPQQHPHHYVQQHPQHPPQQHAHQYPHPPQNSTHPNMLAPQQGIASGGDAFGEPHANHQHPHRSAALPQFPNNTPIFDGSVAGGVSGDSDLWSGNPNKYPESEFHHNFGPEQDLGAGAGSTASDRVGTEHAVHGRATPQSSLQQDPTEVSWPSDQKTEREQGSGWEFEAEANLRAMREEAGKAAGVDMGIHPPLDLPKAQLPKKVQHKPGVIKSIPSDDALKEDYRRLSERLRVYGLKEKVVRGDGNCQFRALADQLFNDANRHEETRKAVIAVLKRKPDDYKCFVPDNTYSAYIDRMSKDGTWGDHLTLQAAADAYGIRLCVITSYQESFLIEIVPKKQRSQKVLWISFWAEIHYNSVYPDDSSWE